jgi:hypothetical protein
VSLVTNSIGLKSIGKQEEHVSRVTQTCTCRLRESRQSRRSQQTRRSRRRRIRLGGAGPKSERYQDFSTASGSSKMLPINSDQHHDHCCDHASPALEMPTLSTLSRHSLPPAQAKCTASALHVYTFYLENCPSPPFPAPRPPRAGAATARGGLPTQMPGSPSLRLPLRARADSADPASGRSGGTTGGRRWLACEPGDAPGDAPMRGLGLARGGRAGMAEPRLRWRPMRPEPAAAAGSSGRRGRPTPAGSEAVWAAKAEAEERAEWTEKVPEPPSSERAGLPGCESGREPATDGGQEGREARSPHGHPAERKSDSPPARRSGELGASQRSAGSGPACSDIHRRRASATSLPRARARPPAQRGGARTRTAEAGAAWQDTAAGCGGPLF